jgi:hypothetical protein
LLPPYFIRADINLETGDLRSAERDLETIQKLLNMAGGFSEGEEAQAAELEARILIEKKRFDEAKKKIQNSNFLPTKVAERLSALLARAVGFEPQAASPDLRRWAATYGNSQKRK